MRIVICGAGIAGLAAASRLRQHGCDVHIVERAAGPRPQGYMIDFFGPGYSAATAMGLRDRLHERGQRVQEVRYVDGSGRRRVALKYDSFVAAADSQLVSIMRPDLEALLRESLDDETDLRFGTTITDIDNRSDGVSLTFSDGTSLEADLLLAADGIHSATRAAVFGAEPEYLRYLGMHTSAFTVDDDDIYRAVRNAFVLTDSIDRQIGFYSVKDGQVTVFTVHRTPDPSLPADPRAAVRDAYAGLGWYVPRLLDKCPPSEEIYYDQVAQIILPKWVNKRVALLGDAAHAVSLVAGQGASLAVAGAYILAERLHDSPSVDAALSEYEQRWRPATQDAQAAAWRGTRWFLPHTPLRAWTRRWAMRGLNVPVLNRYLATGLVGKSHDPVAQL